MTLPKVVMGVVLMVSIGGAMADAVEDQIGMGLEAYQAKDYKVAIDELNYAVAQIQEKLNAANNTLLPDAPDGWSASEVENASAGMAMMGGGAHMSRSYQRGEQSVEISIMAGSPMITGGLAMINNPMLLASDPSIKPYRYKRNKGMKQTSDGAIEVTLAVAGQIMVQLSGSGVDDATLEKFLDAMDFDAIQESLLQ